MPKDKIELPFLRTEHNYDRREASKACALLCKDESKAKQSFAEESDINTIVRRFGLTGQLPTDVRAPTYGDFTEVMDFHTAMNAVAQAGEAFDRMPAAVRARFNNDPGAFVDFCSNPDNLPEMEKMGLTVPRSTQKAVPDKKEPPSPVTTSKELGGDPKDSPKKGENPTS